MCRTGAGLCGNMQAELAPTMSRDELANIAGFTQSGGLSKTAGRSIKRMVQLREFTPDRYNWESLVEG